MKVDNIFINENAAEKVAFTGTISYDERIVKLQNSDEKVRNDFLTHLIAPSLTNDAIKYMMYTHCGTHHADEIYSVALVLLCRNSIANRLGGMLEFISSDQIISSVKRVRSIENIEDPMDKCLVMDLLDGHYDHHHKNPDDRKDYPDSILINKAKWIKPIKMATFGALWSDIGHIFDLEGVEAPNVNVWELMLARFILPMDQQDNYGPNYCESPNSKIISNVNSYSEFEDFENLSKKSTSKKEEKKDENKEEKFIPLIPDFKFVEAVKLAYTILRNEIMSMQRLVQAMKDIKENDKISFRNCGTITQSGGERHFYPLTGIEIATVEKDEKVPSIVMDAVNDTVFEQDGKEYHPLFLITKHPDKRDGLFRLILGKFIKMDPKRVLENCGDLIHYIHPNDGFLVSFETEEKMEKFLNEYFPALVKFQ